MGKLSEEAKANMVRVDRIHKLQDGIRENAYYMVYMVYASYFKSPESFTAVYAKLRRDADELEQIYKDGKTDETP